jgi:hypothetical protein
MDMTVPVVPSDENSEMQSHVLFCKNVHQYLADLLCDPLYIHEIEWMPQKTHKSTSGGWMHFISQPWTADEFWDIMVCCLFLAVMSLNNHALAE